MTRQPVAVAVGKNKEERRLVDAAGCAPGILGALAPKTNLSPAGDDASWVLAGTFVHQKQASSPIFSL